MLLGLLPTLGPFSNDNVLPDFPPIQSGFGVSSVQMQQTLSAYFLPFAVMMLLHGTRSKPRLSARHRVHSRSIR